MWYSNQYFEYISYTFVLQNNSNWFITKSHFLQVITKFFIQVNTKWIISAVDQEWTQLGNSINGWRSFSQKTADNLFVMWEFFYQWVKNKSKNTDQNHFYNHQWLWIYLWKNHHSICFLQLQPLISFHSSPLLQSIMYNGEGLSEKNHKYFFPTRWRRWSAQEPQGWTSPAFQRSRSAGRKKSMMW